MAKYKNISNLKVVITHQGNLLQINPNDVVDLDYCPISDRAILSEIVEIKIEKTPPKEEAEEVLDQDLEDSIVIVSDAIIESLAQKEQKPKSRKRKN